MSVGGATAMPRCIFSCNHVTPSTTAVTTPPTTAVATPPTTAVVASSAITVATHEPLRLQTSTTTVALPSISYYKNGLINYQLT